MSPTADQLAALRPDLLRFAWPDPDKSPREQEFWRVFETCLGHLPPAIGRAFMMHELLGFESDEICRLLRSTTSNCHVMLHRAR